LLCCPYLAFPARSSFFCQSLGLLNLLHCFDIKKYQLSLGTPPPKKNTFRAMKPVQGPSRASWGLFRGGHGVSTWSCKI
jgi:hypothetical protein